MSADQRTRSRRVILDHIRRATRIARIDLARATGMSQATVTTLTADMLRQGLIEEVAPEDAKDTRRGRPRVDLKLRGAAHLVAGVKIANRSVSVVIMDFEGIKQSHHKVPLADLSRPPDALGWIVRQAVEAAAGKAGIKLDKLSGVGVGIAGFVDALAGQCHWSPSLDRRNVALRDILAQTLALPVFIDNDANLVAMAEQYFGEGRDVTDFIVVTVESGVGMGIVLDNRLYRGKRGCGAEFGHTKVHLDGALCRCGQRGCLEAYLADYALMREAQVLNGGRGVQTVEALLSLSRSGDPMAKSILDRAARMFAMGLANIVNIFDPELIILAGERMRMNHLLVDDLIATIRESIVEVDLEPPRVVSHTWDDLMWAEGAGAYALDGVLDMTLRSEAEHVA